MLVSNHTSLQELLLIWPNGKLPPQQKNIVFLMLSFRGGIGAGARELLLPVQALGAPPAALRPLLLSPPLDSPPWQITIKRLHQQFRKVEMKDHLRVYGRLIYMTNCNPSAAVRPCSMYSGPVRSSVVSTAHLHIELGPECAQPGVVHRGDCTQRMAQTAVRPWLLTLSLDLLRQNRCPTKLPTRLLSD